MKDFAVNGKKTVAKSSKVLDTYFGFVARAAMLLRFFVSMLILLVGMVAFAQTKGEHARPKGHSKVVDLGEGGPLRVVGKIYRPEVPFITGAKELHFEGIPLEWDGLKEVEKSVSKPPF
jgi:hypothetical protein